MFAEHSRGLVGFHETCVSCFPRVRIAGATRLLEPSDTVKITGMAPVSFAPPRRIEFLSIFEHCRDSTFQEPNAVFSLVRSFKHIRPQLCDHLQAFHSIL